MEESRELVPVDAWEELIATLQRDASRPMVPVEDLRPGMWVHNTQFLRPSPLAVYELAKLGLTDKGIAGKYRTDQLTLRKHFSKTIELGRADAAAELLGLIAQKATDEDLYLDKDAVKTLLNRLNPEDKEPTQPLVTLNLGLNPTSFTVDQLNDQLTSADDEPA